uniref:NAC transcription factor 47 n=1 Tax=Litchi chinensis TaxID=151069 RepID=A0A8K1HZD7_LITCN|nr:NAC transcription factor 47 [Litchi chinensis]
MAAETATNGSLHSMFHALEPISRLLSQNSDPLKPPIPLKLTKDSYLTERSGSRYSEYAQLKRRYVEEEAKWKRRISNPRFDPTDQQLVLDYLFNKVNNNPLPSPTAVIDCDVYGEGTAWRVSSVIKRYGDQRVHIGSKRSFSFVPTKGFQENRGKWVMHEYRLDGCLLNKNNSFYVICRIKNMKRKRSNATYDDDHHLDVDVNGAAICVPNDVQDHGHFDHVNNYMGDGSKECLNVSDCVAGNGVGEYLYAFNCMGCDGTGEFLNGGDGLYVSNYMMGGDDTGDCLNVSDYIGGDGIGECLNVSDYMEEWFSLLSNDNNRHAWSSDLSNTNDIGE